VAAENRSRAGADAAMGYPRFGMIDLLKLLGGLLVGVFRSHATREAEMAFLRHQLVVLRRSAPARPRLRTADRLIFVWIYRLFPSLLAEYLDYVVVLGEGHLRHLLVNYANYYNPASLHPSLYAIEKKRFC
jgi:hypothetical protein